MKITDNLTLEQKLQMEWLQHNKPNSYFDTVVDRRVDNLIVVGVSYIENGDKVLDVVMKRRTSKTQNGGEVYHYFTKGNKVFTYEELLIIKEPAA